MREHEQLAMLARARVHAPMLDTEAMRRKLAGKSGVSTSNALLACAAMWGC